MIALIRKHPLLFVFLCNALLRLFYFLEIRNQVFFNGLILDSRLFAQWAEAIAEGDVLGDGPFVLSPLYPYFLAFLFKVFGHDLGPVRWVQHLLGCGTGILVFAIARRVYGDNAAWTSFWLYLLYPLFIFYEGQVLGTSLVIFCFTLAIALLVREKWLGAAILLGLATLGRPNILLVDACVLVWICVRLRSLRVVVQFALGLLLVLFPVTLRNYVVTGDATLVSPHGGINFFLANNPSAIGAYSIPKGLPHNPLALNQTESKRIAEAETDRSLGPGEVSRFWYGMGLRFIADEPWAFLKLEGRKLFFFLHGYEPPVNINIEFYNRFSKLLRGLPVSFALISSLALVGMILELRSRQLPGVVWVVWGSYLASLLIFTVSTRYRLPVAPVMILFASLTVARWISLKGSSARGWIFAGSVVALLVFTRDMGLRKDFSAAYNNFGNMYSRSGQQDTALEIYDQGLRDAPNDPVLRFNRALSLEVLGRWDDALAEYERVYAIDPRFPNLELRMNQVRKAMAKGGSAP